MNRWATEAPGDGTMVPTWPEAGGRDGHGRRRGDLRTGGDAQKNQGPQNALQASRRTATSPCESRRRRSRCARRTSRRHSPATCT